LVDCGAMDGGQQGCHTVALCAARKHIRGGQELASQWLRCGDLALRLVLLASNPDVPSLTIGAFIEVRNLAETVSGNDDLTESPRPAADWAYERVPFGIVAQSAASATRHVVKVDVQRFSSVDVDRGWWHLCGFDEVELTGGEDGAAAFVGGIICPKCYVHPEGGKKAVGGISGEEMRCLTTALQKRATMLAAQYQALELTPNNVVVSDVAKQPSSGCGGGCTSGCLWGPSIETVDKNAEIISPP